MSSPLYKPNLQQIVFVKLINDGMLLKLLKCTKIIIRKQIKRIISFVENDSFPERNVPKKQIKKKPNVSKLGERN